MSSNPIAIWVEATEYRATHKYPHNPAKNPESEFYRDNYGDYLEEYIRVVKYKGFIMGYYRYSLN